MKRFIYSKLPLLAFVTALTVLTATHTAEADVIDKIFGFALDNFVWTIANWASYALLTLASWFLTATGVLLNTSINLTLNISQFVSKMHGVYEVWIAIRDLSGTIIIFFVLWAAFQIILGLQTPGLGNLLKNIVVAGVLINFSFFLTSLLIDASNLVSLQIYRQMIPAIVMDNTQITPETKNATSTGQSIVKDLAGKAYKEGGISDIFMSAFDITHFYTKNDQFKAGDSNQIAIRMFIVQMTGAAAMFVAGFSFIFASLAFLFRLGILIFILAFSPIFFAAFIIPQLSSYSKKGLDLFKGQLIFMPVYLLLMYMALKVVAVGNFTPTNLVFGATADANFWPSLVGLVSNFFFVIVLLTIPLLGALSMGGSATSLANKWTSGFRKWSTGKLKSGGAASWRYSAGRGASAIARTEGFKDFASKSRIGGLLLKGTRGVAGGYEKVLEGQVKTKTQFGESLGYDQNQMNTAQSYLRGLQTQLAQAQAAGTPTANLKTGIRNAKRAIDDLENRRKQDYSSTVNTRSVDTLFTKIARKDKVAAAKLQVPIIQDRITRHKEDLKDTKADLKQIQQAIINNPAGVGTVPMPAIGPTAVATPAQQTKYNQLLGDQVTQTNNINNEESTLDQLKLVS
jgi:hypothetical protein